MRIQRDYGCRYQIQPHCRGWQAKRADHSHHDGRAEQEFQWVVTFRRRDVDLCIAVVNQMETPQQRDLMEQTMFPVPPKVQQQERQQQLYGERKIEP